MGFYKARPTLSEFYAEDNTLFNTFNVPGGVSLAYLVPIILAECGALQTIFETEQQLAAYLTPWSMIHLEAWTKMQAALVETYDPLHNYDRTETEQIEATGTSESTFNGSTVASGEDTTTEQRQGFNSAEFVNADKSVMELGTRNDSNSSTTGETGENRERTLRSYGNIGVTTSQQMLESEIDLRSKYNMYHMIADTFKREICVGVW